MHPIAKELPLKASAVSPNKLCLVSARMHELQMSPVFMRVFLVYTGLESFCSILSCAIRDWSLPGYEMLWRYSCLKVWPCMDRALSTSVPALARLFVQIMNREFSADSDYLILSVGSWKRTQVKELKMSVHLRGPTSRSWRFNENQDLPRSSIHKN